MSQVNEILEIALKHHQDGQLESAKSAYKQVLEQVDNDPPGVIHLLGLVCHQLGEFQEAEPLFEKILEKEPTNATYQFNMGLLHIDLDKPESAETCLRQATQLQPEYSEAWEALAAIYESQNDTLKAASIYEKLAQLAPDEPKWARKLAELYDGLGNADKALTHWIALTTLAPDDLDTAFKVGKHYYDVGLLEKAAAQFKGILSRDKQHNQAILFLAQSYSGLGKAREARTYFQALYVKSLIPGFRFRRMYSLPVVYQSVEEAEAYRESFLQDLEDLENEPLTVKNPVSEIGMTPFYLVYQGENDKALMSRIGDLLTRCLPEIKHFQHPLVAKKRPKIAVVSRDLHSQHTIQRVFAKLVAQLDSVQFDIIECPIISFGKTQSPQALHPDHRVVPLYVSDYWQACDQLIQEQVDVILYTDLGMEPMSTYLACHRLAPIQCNLWGHPVTSGLPQVDYYLSNQWMEPPQEEAQEHYRETVVLLDEIQAVFDRVTPEKTKVSKASFGFSPQDHLYLCPQTLYKFHPAFDDTLKQILLGDPQGKLVIFGGKFQSWTEQLKARWSESFAPHVDLLDRVVVLSEMPRDQFLQLLSVSEVLLDTPMFGGGCSSLDALSVGTPIITLEGPQMRQRMTAGFYKRMGYTECIASTPEEYVQLALHFGQNPDALTQARQTLLDKGDCLYGNQAVQSLEGFLRKTLQEKGLLTTP